MKKLFLFFILIVLVSSISLALENTQQTNKIFLNPFYRQSMSSDTPYTYTLRFNPSDGVTEVTSAIVTYQMWLTPTVDFSLTVNGNTCNTPSYQVHTTYASAGEGTIYFDCSDEITTKGNYTIVLTSSKNTGAITGWADITYINNQTDYVGSVGSVSTVDSVSNVASVTSVDSVKRVEQTDITVFGTEYVSGEKGTIFVQLIDSQNQPVTDGACFLDIFAPSSVNSSHPYYLKNAPMINQMENVGLYYYDLVAPSILGVYMLSARCSYSFSGGFIYFLDLETNKPKRNSTIGTHIGDTIFLNDFEDWIYTQCSSANSDGQKCKASYDFNTSLHWGNTTNFTNINLYYMAESSKAVLASFSVWNWSSSKWIALPNNVTLLGGATTPLGIGEFASNPIPTSNIISPNNVIRVQVLASFGSSFTLFNNWLNIQLQSANGDIATVKGSGEIHITDSLRNATALSNQIANTTWNYSNRQLTQFNFDVIDEVLVSNYVWNNTNRTLTTFNFDVVDEDLISIYVWNYTNRTLSTFDFAINATATVNSTDIANSVWSYSGTITTNILEQIADAIWEFIGGVAEII